MPDAEVDDEYSGEMSVATEEVQAANNITVVFDNRHSYPMYLFWKPPDRDQEAFMGVVKPKDSFQISGR
eukprot:g7519.t1